MFTTPDQKTIAINPMRCLRSQTTSGCHVLNMFLVGNAYGSPTLTSVITLLKDIRTRRRILHTRVERKTQVPCGTITTPTSTMLHLPILLVLLRGKSDLARTGRKATAQRAKGRKMAMSGKFKLWTSSGGCANLRLDSRVIHSYIRNYRLTMRGTSQSPVRPLPHRSILLTSTASAVPATTVTSLILELLHLQIARNRKSKPKAPQIKGHRAALRASHR